VLHIGDIFGHLSGVLVLLSDNGLDAGLDIGLIVSVAHSTHTFEEIKRLQSHLLQFGLPSNGVVQPGAKFADLVGHLLMLLQI
jgi:hypothetical protein